MQRAPPAIARMTANAGIQRSVLVSAFGVGDTRNRGRLAYRTIVAAIFRAKRRPEKIPPAIALLASPNTLGSTEMDLELTGRSVLITGASRGIGAAASEVFAQEGCSLHLAARDHAALDAIAGRLRTSYGTRVRIHPVDLRDPQQLAALAAAVPDLDILVNNAGDIPAGSIHQVDAQAWRHAWDLKVHGYIDLTRLIYVAMKENGRGVIINNIGAAGESVNPDYIAGSAGNAALMALTRALGGRSLKDGIRVVGVNPGPVATDRMLELASSSEQFRKAVERFPGGRAAEPREIADMMAFLASDRSAYTSGTVVTIDGGMSVTAM
ncbi:short-chain dehydrogenase/reductase [Streptomyces hokutonensis]|uniref:short-chain dehydrogenase/reductase n=1 Tax=Streptomyces hokutonensis TaxID=1306990 RepID=UPI003803D1EB